MQEVGLCKHSRRPRIGVPEVAYLLSSVLVCGFGIIWSGSFLLEEKGIHVQDKQDYNLNISSIVAN